MRIRHPPGSSDHASYSGYTGGSAKTVNWKKSAYVQIVREHVKVCDAAMQFAELAKQKSRAQRVLFYPRRWDIAAQKGWIDKESETSVRLLQQVAERYGVIVSGIDPLLDATDLEAAYPLSGLLSLTSFDKILYLQPSGLVVDASALDSLFSINTTESLVAFSDSTDSLPPLLLIQPSKPSFHTAVETLNSNPSSEHSYLHSLTSFLPSPPSAPPISASTSSLQSASINPDFTASSFLEDTGYIHVSDPGILGPEFDIPWNTFLAARPEGEEARRAWENAYEMYRERRMGVCGLDLEPLPIIFGPEEPAPGYEEPGQDELVQDALIEMDAVMEELDEARTETSSVADTANLETNAVKDI
jgi:hypothetical protein